MADKDLTDASSSNENPLGAMSSKDHLPGASPSNDNPTGAMSSTDHPPQASTSNNNPLGAMSSKDHSPGASPSNNNPLGAMLSTDHPPGASPSNKTPLEAMSSKDHPPGASPSDDNPLEAMSSTDHSPGASPSNVDSLKESSSNNTLRRASSSKRRSLRAAPSRQHSLNELPLDILILGQAGSGRSATGNSILLRRAFKTSTSSSYATSDIQSAWNDFRAKNETMYRIKVTDGPSLEEIDPKKAPNNARAYEGIAKILAECPRGIHAILITVRTNVLFTYETYKMVNSVEKILGKDCLDKCGIVAVTGGDHFEDDDDDEGDEERRFEEWCKQQTRDLQKVFTKCRNRRVLFDNKQKDWAARKQQLESFLGVAEKVASANGWQRYKPDLFYQVQRESQDIMSVLTTVSEEIRQELSVLQGKISNIKSEADAGQVVDDLQPLSKQIESDTAYSSQARNLKTMITELGEILHKLKSSPDCAEDFDESVGKAKLCIKKMMETSAGTQDPKIFQNLGKKLSKLQRPWSLLGIFSFND